VHFASEEGELLLFVVFEGIGLNVHGFVAIRFFGVGHLHREDGGEGAQQSQEFDFHKGANLAWIVGVQSEVKSL
jgi:hypothetical protein